MFLLLALTGCDRVIDCARPRAGVGGSDHRCRVPGFRDREVRVHLPDAYDEASDWPLVMVLHGGGSNNEGADAMTCPEGELGDPACMSAVGTDRGYLVAFPQGTSRLGEIRTWNAGGGTDGWQCVSGKACADEVDELAYFDALLDELQDSVTVDPDRVFAAGHSNGAAMSHRLACQRADRFAAIAPNAAPNQFSTTEACEPSRPVAVLQMHGTDDDCMPYEGGENGCVPTEDGVSLGIEQSNADWAARNGCEAIPAEEALPDEADDGTTTVRQSWPGCADGGEVEHLRIEGGGHAWPGGYTLSSKGGTVPRDFDGDELVLDFFDAHGR